MFGLVVMTWQWNCNGKLEDVSYYTWDSFSGTDGVDFSICICVTVFLGGLIDFCKWRELELVVVTWVVGWYMNYRLVLWISTNWAERIQNI